MELKKILRAEESELKVTSPLALTFLGIQVH